MTRTGRVKAISERRVPVNQNPGGPFPADPKAAGGYTGHYIEIEFAQPEGLPDGSPATATLNLQVSIEEAQGLKIGQTITLG